MDRLALRFDLTMGERVHVVGAGLAGLSSAVELTDKGIAISLYEAAGYAGGRTRSLFEPSLERTIDNGNHLMLSGNWALMAFLEKTGGLGRFHTVTPAVFPFLDLTDGKRWQVRPNRGPIPWSLIFGSGWVPDAHITEYLRALRLIWAGEKTTVAECLRGNGVLWERFWQPLALAVVNTELDQAAAALLWPVLKETFGRGEKACRPMIPKVGLSDALINPALGYLRERGASIEFNQRLRGLILESGRVVGLEFADHRIDVAADDSVILAVPPLAVTALLPELGLPIETRAIVNGHFRLPAAHLGEPLLGLIGGTSEWLFVRGDVVSATVSAADGIVSEPSEAIAGRMWANIVDAYNLQDQPLGAYRIIKEKRATFAQTPAQERKRPAAVTEQINMYLAGDWTAIGLPATMEGAVRSGSAAAQLICDC